jgi:Ca2+-binding EF-hand superfamily protein
MAPEGQRTAAKQQWDAGWSFIDSNHDGEISKSELNAIINASNHPATLALFPDS